MTDMVDIEAAYAATEENDAQYYSVNSVTLGELYEDGLIDWEDDSWSFPKYSDAQHAQLCRKITNRFYDRDIGVLPVLSWKREFLRKLDEIMPKYIPLYKKLDERQDSLNATDEYYKSRNIVSDFPQTQLSGNEDYASMGTDHEYERLHDGTVIDMAGRLREYDDVDVMILNELESMFSCLMTVSMNNW